MKEVKVVNQGNMNSIVASVLDGSFVRIVFENAYVERLFKKVAVTSGREVVVVSDKTQKGVWVAFAI